MTELDPVTRRMVEAIARAVVAQAAAEVDTLNASMTEQLERRRRLGESLAEAIERRRLAVVQRVLRDNDGRITAIVTEAAEDRDEP